MNSKKKIIEQLNQILGDNRVLTDLEDIYVYSFEKIFLNKREIIPDIIVRVSSLSEENEVKSLLDKENAIVIERDEYVSKKINKSSKMIVLLDNVKIPTLEKCVNEIGFKQKNIEKFDKLELKGIGTFRNLAVAVANFFLGKTLIKCQECTTCSGYCTVSSSFNGIESWSSKGRMLITRGIMKGELTLSEKIVDILYNCTKCGLCYAQCFQNLEFHEAIIYLRHLIAEKNLTPQIFKTTATNIFEYGDPAAISMNRRLNRIKNISKLNLPVKAKTLGWLGCTVATRTPKTAEAFIKILKQSNTDFTMLGEKEGCCGYVLISSGLWKEAEKIAKETVERIEKTNAQTLITPCSGCYYTFTRLYPEILDINMPCEVLHTSQFLEKKIKNEEINLKPLDLEVTYHDPCSLGRHCKVYDPPRNVLKGIPKLKIVEMSLNRECARCCGGGGGLWTFNNKVSLESTQIRLKEDVFPTNVSILTTACPQCQLNFRFASRMKYFAEKPIKIYDVTELFALAM